MNQEKIGKLIAKLRKEKGLTQQELGDKVSVGYRAVSKWERGVTLPDITIINDLSEILGITSDELLKGELNENHITVKEKKSNFKILILATILVVGILLFVVFNNKNESDVYNLTSGDPNAYHVNGKLVILDDGISISINKLGFEDYSFNKTIIKNYEYYLFLDDAVIYSYGYNKLVESLEHPIKLEEFLQTFKFEYKLTEPVNIDEIIGSNLSLKFIFIDNNDNEIIMNVEIAIVDK